MRTRLRMYYDFPWNDYWYLLFFFYIYEQCCFSGFRSIIILPLFINGLKQTFLLCIPTLMIPLYIFPRISKDASKAQFFHLWTRHNNPDNYLFSFNDTYLFPSSTLLSFTHNFKLNISSLASTAFMNLGFSEASPPIFSISPTAISINGPCLFMNGIQSFSFYEILSSDCQFSASLYFRLNVASLAIFHHYFLANYSIELANCIRPLLLQPRRTGLLSNSYSV